MTRRLTETRRSSAALASVIVLTLLVGVGCPPPAFVEHGPRVWRAGGGGPTTAERLAWKRPEIVVSPVDVMAGNPARYEALEHTADGSGWLLRLQPEAGEPVELRYRVADGVRLPVEEGEQLWFNQSSSGVGLMIKDDAGIPRAVISIDGELADAVDDMLAPSFDVDRLVYSEVVTLPSGCLLVLDHHELEVRQQNQRSFVVPGSVTRVGVPSRAGEIPMDLYALDVSRPSPRRQERDDPRCPAMATVSWMLLRAP